LEAVESGGDNLINFRGGTPVRRIKVSFAGLEVEFVDRERALAQIRELGERGTFPVYVVYGPEGRGKTTLLKLLPPSFS